MRRKLELSKCFAYILSYDWVDGDPVLQPTDTMVSITIQDSESGKFEDIEVRSPFKAHKTLGSFMCPTGDMTAHMEFLGTKMSRLAACMTALTGPLWRVKLAYSSRVVTAVSHSLEVTNFTFAQCDKLQRPLTRATLGALRVNRMLPRAVAYGLPTHGCLDIQHAYRIQSML